MNTLFTTQLLLYRKKILVLHFPRPVSLLLVACFSVKYLHEIAFFMIYTLIVSRSMCDYRRGLDWSVDLLTIYRA
jgi:hypothetical protein